jgi:very-short-patch-repair endonuclease
MVMESIELDPSSERAVRLFQYLKELSVLRTRTIRSIDSYESVLWFSDVPHEPECFAASWFQEVGDYEGDEWLVIHKPLPLQDCPDIPEELLPWVDQQQLKDSSENPELRPEIELAGVEDTSRDDAIGDPQTLSLSDHPEIVAQWEDYLHLAWKPWAAEDQRRRRIQSVYSQLFSIYQRQQRLGEQYEVVLGLGLLGWRTPAGQVVRRHLLTAQTGITFDPISGKITVGPAGEGAQLTIEQDMLEATEQPDAAEAASITRHVKAIGEDIWHKSELDAVLAAWVHAVSAQGHYEHSDDPAFAIAGVPVVRLAPAVILRKRNERSLLRMFQDIIELLEEGNDLPPGVRRLVEVVDDANFNSESGSDDNATASDTEIYFPLPANDEQRDIISRLQTRQGVLVQGPPGTGKSHTIANLICHLLATGKRVLVTSHTPRALKVLRDKIPSEIAPLCVSLLGDDQVALANLEDSVLGITDRFNSWDARQGAQVIRQLSGELDVARRAEARALQTLIQIRQAETERKELPVPGYEGTAEAIARQLVAESEEFSWLTIRPAVSVKPPLDDREALRLLSLLREISPERESELRRSRCSSTQLLAPQQFNDLVQREQVALEAFRQYEHFSEELLAPFAKASAEARDELAARLDDLIRTSSGLLAHPDSWVGLAVGQVLGGRTQAWLQLHTETQLKLGRVEALYAQHGQIEVRGLEGRSSTTAKVDASDLLSHLSSGGKWGIGPLRPEPVKRASYLIEGVTVDGRRCNQIETLNKLLGWFAMMEDLQSLRSLWEPHTVVEQGAIGFQIAAYRDLLGLLQRVLQISTLAAQARSTLAKFPEASDSQIYEIAAVTRLRTLVAAANKTLEVQQAKEPLNRLADFLETQSARTDVHDVVSRLAVAARSRNVQEYATHFATLVALEADQQQLMERDLLQKRLRADAAPLCAELETTFEDEAWNQRLASFTAAWNWARAEAYLGSDSGLQLLQKTIHDLEKLRKYIDQTMSKLAAARAWSFCFERMTEAERQSLMAWMQAMRRIGKGTGKYAAEHRRAARKYMEECRSAIPAWIMPIYRVAETVRPGADMFDVVIVDEASQSGPEALFLQFIARQIVVVGDDQQISPEAVGLSREDVAALQSRFIPDLRFRESLGVENSFFDQAVIRFGGRIRLREHFRCMPEIIEFSNLLSYRSEPLYPLRQYGMDRLEPIKVVHVPEGYRKGEGTRITNPPEAQALVDQVIACCEDPRYAGKTMGVISLQGEYQAREIERLLIDQLGPEEFESRQLVCGDAYAFQGDERDVIFMSMVAARSQTFTPRPLTGAADVRRFNVAASRARDQVWLFHTVTLNDLNPNCLRYRLLDYYTNYTDYSTRSRGEDESSYGIFDSPFERDVYVRIKERGYRVRSQVPVAGYRIDLVIDGSRGSLAVECDGERWHGAERFQADMDRQRHLERCGWTFWRVRGSDFYRDPERALDDLWTTLNRLGIEPEPGSALPETGFVQQVETDNVSPQPVQSSSVQMRPTTDLPDEERSSAANRPDNESPSTSPPEVSEPDDQVQLPPPIDSPGEDAPSTPSDHVEQESGFAPFKSWQKRELPDPLTADRQQVLAGLLEIIEAEGPMPFKRAYRLYADAVGLEEIDTRTRSVFNQVAHYGVRQRFLAAENETGEVGQMHLIARIAGTPMVRLREPGDRSLADVPPSEIAAALRMLSDDIGLSIETDAHQLFQWYLDFFDLESVGDSEQQSHVLAHALRALGLPSPVEPAGS